MKKYFLILLGLYCCNIWSESCDTQVAVCFTPTEHCTPKIVNAIDSAKKQILIQAYSFTSAPIAEAILNAKKRGVDIKILLDKSQVSEKYSSATFFENAHIPVYVDYKVRIAHNKVIIIDNAIVLGGSFNYSKSAEFKNAENVTFMKSACMANRFAKNWADRENESIPINNYRNQHQKHFI